MLNAWNINCEYFYVNFLQILKMKTLYENFRFDNSWKSLDEFKNSENLQKLDKLNSKYRKEVGLA